jgi:hypothetical protein
MTLRNSFLAMLSAVALSAQTPRPANPAYLSEMPAPDRVFREITAADPVERATRQAGAFQQLQDIIEELSAPRAALGNFTPDENRVLGDYRTARVTAMKSVEERHVPMLRRYDNDPALRDEILNRFFSPAFRARSLAVSAEMQRRIAIIRQTAPAFGGTPARTSAAAPAPSVAPPAPPAPPLPPDPSIAKARAANVDTKVFSIQLGDRLSLPACNMMAALVATTQSCRMEGMLGAVSALTAAMVQGPGSKYDIVLIRLAQANCPSWIADCMASATVDPDGRVVAISAATSGKKVEADASRELRGKYGRPFMARERHITQTDGPAKFDVWDLEWQLPGLHVEYFVVDETIFKGSLSITTEAYFAVISAKRKEAARPKL